MPFAEAERKLIVALDMPDAGEAYEFWQRLALPNATAKIGLELLMSGGGVELARKIAAAGASVFVDAKLFDIGATVERSTARVAALGAAFLTVHAQDRQTVEAAVRGGAGSGAEAARHYASHKHETRRPWRARDYAFGTGVGAAARGLRGGRRVLWRGFVALGGGGPENQLRQTGWPLCAPAFGPKSETAMAGDDQARTATPSDALRAGADYIVVGRPITRASDPAAAARAIIAEMANALRD